MANSSFFNGGVYVRDYVLSAVVGMQNEMGHSDTSDPEYQAYQKVYDMVVDRFGDMFTDFKG
jgi:hypothetical protein